MPLYRSRTEDEIIRISAGVRRYYAQKRTFAFDRHGYNTVIKEKIDRLYTHGNMFKVYDQFMQAKGLRETTRLKELYSLVNGLRYALKSPLKMNQGDVYRWVAEIENNEFSNNYKAVLKTTVRSLFKFLGKAELVEWIKARPEPVRDRCVTLKEVRKIMNSTPIFEEKVFFALLWESCCRVSELLNLTIDDLRFEKGVCYLRIMNSKNKHSDRFIPILKKGRMFPLGSCGMLVKFIKNVKNTKNTNCNKYYNTTQQKIQIQVVNTTNNRLWTWTNPGQIQHIFRKARLKLEVKDLHAHLFRKSRATFLDNYLSLKQLSAFGGWSPNSKVLLETYVLCSYRDLTALLKMKNLARTKEGWN